MGHRGEVFSTRAAQKNRTYFFNIKENRAGDWFLNVVESKQQSAEGFERHQIVVFEEDLDDFLSAMERAVNYMKNKKQKRGRGRARSSSGRPGSSSDRAGSSSDPPRSPSSGQRPPSAQSRSRNADEGRPEGEGGGTH